MKTKGILQFTYSKTFLLCKTVYLVLTFLFVACESLRNSFLKVIIFIRKEMNFYLPKGNKFSYVNIGFFGLWKTAAVSFHINWTQPVTSFKSFKFKLPVKIKNRWSFLFDIKNGWYESFGQTFHSIWQVIFINLIREIIPCVKSNRYV